MTLSVEVHTNPDGSPTGTVVVSAIGLGEDMVVVSDAREGARVDLFMTLKEFASFAGAGLEAVREAEANEDPS